MNRESRVQLELKGIEVIQGERVQASVIVTWGPRKNECFHMFDRKVAVGVPGRKVVGPQAAETYLDTQTPTGQQGLEVLHVKTV